MSFRRPEKGLFSGAAVQVQGAVQGVDGKAVGVGPPLGRLGSGVAVKAVCHALRPAAGHRPPRWDGPRDTVRRREVPDYPVGKALYGVAHVLQSDS